MSVSGMERGRGWRRLFGYRSRGGEMAGHFVGESTLLLLDEVLNCCDSACTDPSWPSSCAAGVFLAVYLPWCAGDWGAVDPLPPESRNSGLTAWTGLCLLAAVSGSPLPPSSRRRCGFLLLPECSCRSVCGCICGRDRLAGLDSVWSASAVRVPASSLFALLELCWEWPLIPLCLDCAGLCSATAGHHELSGCRPSRPAGGGCRRR